MIYRIVSWALILFACFYGIGSYPLLDDNEGLYAAIARDMLHSGQWIIPHLNGVPYLEKPPMLYWLIAGSMSLFGENEWAARLVPALAFFGTACLLQRFLTRTSRSEAAGYSAALIMVTSLPMLAMGRMILCDTIMTCFLSAALMYFYDWYTDQNKRSLMGFYMFLALAVLTKGFIAIILAGGTIAAFLYWQRSTPRQQFLRVLSPRGILLFLCIAAPWHIAASWQEPGFAWFYFINEHLLRFLNMREPHDYYTGHSWYYLPRLLAYLLPWTLFLALLVEKPGLVAWQYPVLTKFLWSWFLFCLLFFSVSGAKANYYMIAGIPALVMLLALHLKCHMDSGTRIVPWLASGCLLLVAVALWVIRCACRESSGDLYPTCEAVSLPIIISAGVYALISILLCWRIPRRWIVPLLGAHILLLLPLLISGVNMASDHLSQKTVADFLKASSYHDVAVYQEFEELSSLAFYRDKPLLMVDSRSNDLLYGKMHSATPYFMTLSEWATHSPRLPLVLFTRRISGAMADLRAINIDLKNVCIVRRFERVAVISMCD